MKFTVLGAAGRMGRMHAQHLIEMGHQVCGVDQNWPTGSGWDAMEIDWSDDWSDGCDDSDGVIIATPSRQHIWDLSTAIDLGKHVFVEKPICLINETRRARNLLEDADREGLIVAVGYNLRFHPLVMQAKRMIETDNFKPLWGSFLLRQKPQRPLAYFLEEWASHEIDLAMHLLGGGNIVKANSCKDNIKLAIDHVSSVSFIHADATTMPPYRRAFTLVDQDGKSFTRDIELQHVQPEHYKQELAAWVNRIVVKNEPALNERSLENVLVDIRVPLATGWEGLDVIRLLDLIDG